MGAGRDQPATEKVGPVSAVFSLGRKRCPLGMRTRDRLRVLRDVVRLALEKDVSFLAGSIAFFAFVSLVPAMVLLLAVGRVVGGEEFATAIVRLVEQGLSDEGTEVLGAALADTTGLAGASAIGVLVLLWSTFRVFRALDIAFDRIYQTETSTSLARNFLDGAIVVSSITATLVVLLLVRMTVRLFSLPYANTLSVGVMLLGLVAVLTPLYYVMPPVSVPVREVLPGTVWAVLGLVLLHQLFHLYTAQANQYQAYGFMGAVLLFLLWLYVGAIILLVGAVINATLTSVRRETATQPAARESLPGTSPRSDGKERDRDGEETGASTSEGAETPRRPR